MTTQFLPGQAPPDDTPGSMWLKASSVLTAVIPAASGREDVIVHIRPGAGHGAPAAFFPDYSVIEVDGAHLLKEGVNPASLKPDLSDRDRYPVTWGATIHEAGHAQHTVWARETTPAERGTAAYEAAKLLEEPRMERAQLDRRPGDRRYLRPMVEMIVKGEGGAPTQRGAVAKALVLMFGRVEAGVLDPDEVLDIEELARNTFFGGKYPQMKDIIRKAVAMPDDDKEGMLKLGQEWVDLLKDDAGTPPPSEDGDGDPSPGSGDGDSSGDGSGGDPPPNFPMPEAVERALSKAAEAVAEHDEDPFEKARRDSEAAAKEEASAEREAKQQSKATFGTFGDGGDVGTGGVSSWRAPTPEESGAAAILAKALRQATVRERTSTPVTSILPPGRLRTRAAIGNAAARAQGRPATSEPFRRLQKKVPPNPPLAVGLLQDVSGSQRAFAPRTAVLAWEAAMAGHLVPQTRVAMANFGKGVKAVIFPRRKPDRVPVVDANDGHEDIAEGIAAMDGALSLSRRGQARLLLIFTDGIFVKDGEPERAERAIRRLLKTGCRVIWVHTGSSSKGDYRQRGLVLPGVGYVDATGVDGPGKIVPELSKEIVAVMKEGRA